MYSIAGKRFNFSLICLFTLMPLFVVPPAKAIMISAVPSSSEVALNEAFSVDLVISGLEQQQPEEIVKGYQLDVAYDPTIVSATNVMFGSYLSLGHPLTPFLQTSDITTSGIVTVFETSLWDSATLASVQPDSFVLASISFEAMALGATTFDFLPYLGFGIDIKGWDGQLLSVEPISGSINVIPAVSIPEPHTLLLLGVGLLLIVQLQRGQVHTQQ